MAIATFPARRTAAIDLFARGVVDVDAGVELTKKFFDLFGAETNEEELRQKYTHLAGLGYAGRFCPRLPADITFEHLLEVVEALRPQGVNSVWRWSPMWTPGTERNSLTKAELDGSDEEFAARLLLRSAVPGNFDPALHFRGRAWDDIYRKAGQPTQLELIDQAVAKFGTAHEGANLQVADARDALVCIGLDRLAGVEPKSPQFFLNQGFMRAYGRRSVGGDSVVAVVHSGRGQSFLGRSYGNARRLVWRLSLGGVRCLGLWPFAVNSATMEYS